MNYYYLAATLPELTLEGKPAFSPESFLATAAEHLSQADRQALAEIESLWDSEPRHPFVKCWKAHETALRNALVRHRASSLRKNAETFLREQSGYDSDAEHAVTEAFSRTNPLEREQILDRCRWSVLDRMAGFNPFSSEAILAYSIRLRIAARWSTMNEDKGKQIAEAVISTKISDHSMEAQSNLSKNNDKLASKS